jgi:hypothetical protein
MDTRADTTWLGRANLGALDDTLDERLTDLRQRRGRA